jgi:CHAT domain-containing protein/tetratricopeptide (TPR) repeat protein
MISLMLLPAAVVADGIPLTQEVKPSADAALKDQAHSLNQEALALSRKGELTAAIEKFKQASDLFGRAKDHEGVAAMNTYISLTYQRLGDWEKCLDHARQARQAWRAAADRLGQVHALRIMGLASQTLGNYKESFAYLTEAISLLNSPADRSLKADLLITIGVFSRSWGDEQKSIEYFQQALAILKDIGPRKKEARALVEIARSYRMMGINETALEKVTEALQLLAQDKDSKWEAQALYEQGEAYIGLGNDRKAVESLEQVLPLARSNGDIVTESIILRQLGDIYGALGDRPKALENLRRAAALSEAVPDSEFKADIISTVGMGYLSLGNYQQAIEYCNRSLGLYRTIDNKVGISIMLASLGLAHEMQGDLQQAINLYLQAITVREEIRTSARLEEIQLSVAGKSFEVYRLAIHLSMRLRQFSQAFDLSERARARSFLDQLGNSRIDFRKGTDPGLIERERTLQAVLGDLEKRLREERAKPLPQIDPQTVRSLEAQLLANQREYAELLTRIKAVNPEYDSLRNMNPLTLAEVQRLLDKDTTLISYFVEFDKVVAFIISRDSFQALEIPVGETALKSEVRLFLDFRSNLKDTQPESLKQLYARLVVPLKPYLKTRVVGIVPHGVLHYLPFAALNDGKNYFGDEHTLYYLPSASVIPFILKNRKQGEQNLLAIAQERAESLPVLSYADQSAETIAKLFNTNALLGSAATETAFRSRAGGSRTLFLAAHGTLSRSNPLFSRIFLAPDGENDGILEVHEVYGLDLSKADLVVLSACQTQLGERSEGDDIIGLNRAFIYAGTPTVVASLWSVQDKQTGELMVSFFKYLRGGRSKAEALQAAQREIRAKYPHPYYWAAFVLTGDPGTGSSINPTRNKRE